MTDNDTAAEKPPDNLVPLTEEIMSEGGRAAAQLEAKRAVFFKATEIVERQLEHDALKMEEAAILSEMPILRRHELMDTARALRMTQSWLFNLRQPAQPQSAT